MPCKHGHLGLCRHCAMRAHAEHLYRVMQVEEMGRVPGADTPWLSFALLPSRTQLGWLAVAHAQVDLGR